MKHLILAVSMALAFVLTAPMRAAADSHADEPRGEYVKKAHAAIDELSVKIDALELKAKEAGASAKEGMDRKVKELKAKRKTAKKKLSKLKRAGAKAWADLKVGVDKGIEDLKQELDKADKDWI